MTRKRKISIAKVHGAAALFAFITRDASELATYFNVTDTTMKRWAKTPHWEHALNQFGFTCSRSFTKDRTRATQRDAGETFNTAKNAYMKAVFDGVPPHQRASRRREGSRYHATTGADMGKAFRLGIGIRGAGHPKPRSRIRVRKWRCYQHRRVSKLLTHYYMDFRFDFLILTHSCFESQANRKGRLDLSC